MFKTIFAKQFTFYICALVTSFSILAVALSSAFSSYFINQKSKMLTEQARRISTVFYQPNVYGIFVYDEQRLRNEVGVLREYLNSSFILLDGSHTIILVSSDIASFSGDGLDLPELDAVFEGGVATFTGDVGGIFSEAVLTVAHPVTAYGEVVGAVLLSSSMPELQRSASEMFRVTLVCLLISAAVAFVLVFILSRTMSKPLREINEAAKVIASGDLEKRITVKSKDEVGQLANSFNNMADSLFEQERLRRVFIANVSHDLRSPLTSMRGFLQAILDGTIPQENQSRYLNIIMDETERLSKLTHDIIDLERVQAADIELTKSSFNLNELIRGTVLMFESMATQKNIAVNLRFANEKTKVHADREKIQRVLYNLVDNAVKFCGDGCVIHIETTLADKKVRVSVKDNGCGISPEDQKRVFDRFFKTDASRGEHKNGSGLGLSIVMAFVKAHGENVSLTSAEGLGSEFVFTLPLSKEKEPKEKDVKEKDAKKEAPPTAL